MSCLGCIPIHLGRIESLYLEIQLHIPEGTKGAAVLRADIAGMYVVTIAAMYENCIKDIMTSYAAKHDARFEYFTNKTTSRLNSRIRPGDLSKYCENFSSEIQENFKLALKRRKDRIRKSTGRNIDGSFEQILSWRHDFAHAGNRNTTVEEAMATHRYAKHVILAFAEAFDRSE